MAEVDRSVVQDSVSFDAGTGGGCHAEREELQLELIVGVATMENHRTSSSRASVASATFRSWRHTVASSSTALPCRPAVETTRSMVVRAKDEPRSWRVTFAPSGFQIEADPIDDDAELLVTGGASELYVLLWNRRDAAGSEMDGEPDLLDLWRETAQIRWS